MRFSYSQLSFEVKDLVVSYILCVVSGRQWTRLRSDHSGQWDTEPKYKKAAIKLAGIRNNCDDDWSRVQLSQQLVSRYNVKQSTE